MARSGTSLHSVFTLAEGGQDAVVVVSVLTRDYDGELLAYGVVNRVAQAEVIPGASDRSLEQATCLSVGARVRVLSIKGSARGRRVHTQAFGEACKNHRGRGYELAGCTGAGRRSGPVLWFPENEHRLLALTWPGQPDDYVDRPSSTRCIRVRPMLRGRSLGGPSTSMGTAPSMSSLLVESPGRRPRTRRIGTAPAGVAVPARCLLARIPPPHLCC